MRGKCTNIRTSNNVAVSRFVPSPCMLTESSNYNTNHNEAISLRTPTTIKHTILTCIKQVTYVYDPDYLTHVHSVALTENGKRISVFEQDKDMSLKVHSYTMDRKGDLSGTSTLRSCNMWLVRDYDYFMSDDHTLCVLFNSEEKAHHRDHRRRRKRGYDSGGTIFISLCKFNLDYQTVKSPSYDFYPNIFMFTLEKKRELDGCTGFWKFLHNFALSRSNLICIVSQGNLKITEKESLVAPSTSGRLLLLDFLQIESEPQHHIKHLFQRDLSKQFTDLGLDKCEDPAIIFNNVGSKILFINNRCVYSIPDGSLVLIQTPKIFEPYWVSNVEHGEIIVNIRQNFFGDTADVSIEILKPLKRGNGDYELFQSFSVMRDVLHCDNGAFYCHAVSNGCVKLFIEEKRSNRRVLIVDPFRVLVSAVLEIPVQLLLVDIINILVNRNEVVVVFREECTEEEILVIYNVPNKVYSLKYLASQATLSYFSVNQLEEWNLPQLIKSYLETF